MKAAIAAVVILLAGPAGAAASPSGEHPCAVAGSPGKPLLPRRFAVKAPKGWAASSRDGMVTSAISREVGTFWVRAEQVPVHPDRCLTESAIQLEKSALWKAGKTARVAVPTKPESSLWYVVGKVDEKRSPCGKFGTPELVGLYQNGRGWYAVNMRLCSGDPLAMTLDVLKSFKPR